jgi:hypothetical protein
MSSFHRTSESFKPSAFKVATAIDKRRKGQMRDPREIQELEAQIASDKQKYSEIERLEDEILGNVPPTGFTEATTIGRYRVEKEALANSIRVAEEMLAGARSQPN